MSPPPSPPLPPDPSDAKRRSIYAELSNYLEDLKSRSATSASSPATEEQDEPVIAFPSNYESVVDLMNSAGDRLGAGALAPVSVGGETPGSDAPFSAGPPTQDSVDWSKYALSEGLGKQGVYYKYEAELKRDQSDRERMEKALAKVQLLDRKISVKESEHGHTLDTYRQEIVSAPRTPRT
jgi:hypothetical protein